MKKSLFLFIGFLLLTQLADVQPQATQGCAIPNCQSCYESSYGQQVCSYCTQGYYLSDTQQCEPCTENCQYCYYSNGESQCYLCLGAYELHSDRQCHQCAEGQYNDGLATATAEIPGTCTSCDQASITNCIDCFSSLDSTQAQQITCLKCQFGYAVKSDNTCESCASLFPTTGAECEQCSYKGAEPYCDKCLLATQIFTSGACTECSSFITECYSCYGNSSITLCSNCNSGFQYNPIENTCTICNQGEYKVLPADTVCVTCNSVDAILNCLQCGTIQSTLTCSQCATGYYLNEAKTSCLSCSNSFSGCQECSVSYGQQIYTYCSLCSATLVWDYTRQKCGSDSCSYTQYTGPNGNCLECTLENCNSCDYSSTDSSQVICNYCYYGYIYDSVNYLCKSCASEIPFCTNCVESQTALTGYHCGSCQYGYQVNKLDNTQCLECSSIISNCNSCGIKYPAGSTTASEASYVCYSCLSGYFDPATETCADCNTILPGCLGCYTYGDQKQCYQCDTGKTLQNGECSDCFFGQFKNGTNQCDYCSDYLPNCQGCSNITSTVSAGTMTCNFCNYGLVLKDGDCVACNSTLPNCGSCLVLSDGSLGCNGCFQGFYLNTTTSSCEPCSSKVDKCSNCYYYEYPKYPTTGTETATGGTATGSTETATYIFYCYSCVQNYFYDSVSQSCFDCGSAIPHCTSCYYYNQQGYTSQYCYQCEDLFVYNYYSGTCSKCQWDEYETASSECIKCSSTIPNCQSCSLQPDYSSIVGKPAGAFQTAAFPTSTSQMNSTNSTNTTNTTTSTLLQCQYCTYGYTYNYVQRTCSKCSDFIEFCSYCFIYETGATCQYCESGYYLDSQTNQCKDCSVLINRCTYCYQEYSYTASSPVTGSNDTSSNWTQTYTPTYTCSQCSSGYYYDRLGTKQCQLCTEVIENCIDCYYYAYNDYYTGNPQVYKNCNQCKPGFTWNYASQICTSCEINQYYSVEGFCINCQDSLPSCLACGYGDIANNTTKTGDTVGTPPSTSTVVKCYKCMDGYGINAEKQCVTCQNAIAQCQNCISTGEGQLTIVKCFNCFPGFYLKNNVCSSCSSSDVDELCLQCQYNVFSNYTQVDCTQCQKGYWWNGLLKSCVACGGEIPKCVDCNITNSFYFNTSTNLFHSEITFSTCFECSDSLYWSPGQQICSKCMSHEYENKDTDCISCSVKTDNCIACNRTYSLTLRDDVVGCLNCSFGYALNAKSECKSCDELVPGCFECYYLNSTNVNCTLCTYGQYVSEGKCLDCSQKDPNCVACYYGSATTSTAGSTGSSSNGWGCSECQTGYYFNRDEGSCQNCSVKINSCLSCQVYESNFYNYKYCYQCESPLQWSDSLQKCSGCQYNEYEEGDECLLCKFSTQLNQNCQTCSKSVDKGVLTCLSCAEGSTLASNQSCISCAQSIPFCSDCTIRFDGSVYCYRCATGSFYNLTDESCSSCSSQLDYCSDCYLNNFITPVVFQCFNCTNGYYYDNINNLCKTCNSLIPRCLACNYSNDGTNENKFCSECPFGQNYNPYTNECSLCQPEEYDLNGDCFLCEKDIYNCQSCIYESSSVKCKSCSYLNTLDTENNVCVKCTGNCAVCQLIGTGNTQTQKCLNCTYGHYLDKTQTCALCSTSVDGCSNCHSVALGLALQVYCTGCQDGLNLVQDQNTCSNCIYDEYLSEQSSCAKCVINIDYCFTCTKKTQEDSSLQCTNCYYGYLLNELFQCKSCIDLIENCYDCSFDKFKKQNQCDYCASGYFNSSATNCSKCSDQISGCEYCYFQNWGDDKGLKCSFCSFGKTLTNGKCTSCSEYQYSDSADVCQDCSQKIVNCEKCMQSGATVQCTNCLQGYTYNSILNTCETCAIEHCSLCNYDYMTNALACQSCDQGYFKNDQNLCVSCADSTVGIADCVECFDRKYISPYMVYYSGMYADYYTKIQAQSNPLICLKCKYGKFVGFNNNCQACSKVEYLDANNICVSCFSAKSGCFTCTSATVCTQCYPNYYLDATTGNCVLCTSVIAGCSKCSKPTSTVQCDLCEFGRLSPDSTHCSDCQVWQYSFSSACNSCQSKVTNCRECSYDDALAADLKTKCKVCYNGYVLTISETAVTTCADCSTSISNCEKCQYNRCQQCKIGHEMNWMDGSCSNCKTWEYLDSAGVCAICDQQFCTQCKQDGQCSQCHWNYFLREGQCVSCSDEIPGCQMCSTDFTTGQLQCTYCNSGSYYDYSSASCLSCSSQQYGCQYCYQSPRQYGYNEQFYCYGCDGGAYLDYNHGNTCQQCNLVISGCNQCYYDWMTQLPNCQSCDTFSGYLLNKDTLQCQISTMKCDDNCVNCYIAADSNNVQAAKCSQCIDGYYINDETGVCKAIIYCLPGQFQKGESCYSCDDVLNGGEEGCFYCYAAMANTWFDGFQCYMCKNDYQMNYYNYPVFYYDQYGKQYYYYFNNDQLCVSQANANSCPAGCTTCTIQIPAPICTVCDTAKNYILKNGQCVLDCSAASVTNCKYCDLTTEYEYVDYMLYPNYWQISANLQEKTRHYCSVCKPGYMVSGMGCIPVPPCEVKKTYHQYKQKCENCPDNCLGCYFSFGDITDTQNSTNQSSTSGKQTVAATGSATANVYFNFDNAQLICRDCELGYQLQPDGTCEQGLEVETNQCSPGCTACDYNNNVFAYDCTTCNAVLDKTVDPVTNVNVCTKDCTTVTANCAKCWFSNSAQTTLVCKQCEDGFSLKLDNSCTAVSSCTVNQYFDPETGACAACSVLNKCTKCKYVDRVLQCFYCDVEELFTLSAKRTCKLKIPGSTQGPCPTEYFFLDSNSNTCLDCPYNCVACSSATTCTRCVENYVTIADFMAKARQIAVSNTNTKSSATTATLFDVTLACIKVVVNTCPVGYFKPSADEECTACSSGCVECVYNEFAYNFDYQTCFKCEDEYNWYLNSKGVCESTYCYEYTTYQPEKGCVWCPNMCQSCRIEINNDATCLACNGDYNYLLNATSNKCRFDDTACTAPGTYAYTWYDPVEEQTNGFCDTCPYGCTTCTFDLTEYKYICSACIANYAVSSQGYCLPGNTPAGSYYGYDEWYVLGEYECGIGVESCYFDFTYYRLVAVSCTPTTQFQLNTDYQICQLIEGQIYNECGAKKMFYGSYFRNTCVDCSAGCDECTLDFNQIEYCFTCSANFILNEETYVCQPDLDYFTVQFSSCSASQRYDIGTQACVNCPAECDTCQNEFMPNFGYKQLSCFSCSANYFYADGYCWKECGLELTKIDSDGTQVCAPCSANCLNCESLRSFSPPKELCTECATGYYLKDYECANEPSCANNQYLILTLSGDKAYTYDANCFTASEGCLDPVAYDKYDPNTYVFCGDCSGDYIYDDISSSCQPVYLYTMPQCTANQYFYYDPTQSTSWSACLDCPAQCGQCYGYLDTTASAPKAFCYSCADGYRESWDENFNFDCVKIVACTETNQYSLFDPTSPNPTCLNCPQFCTTCLLTDPYDDSTLTCASCDESYIVVESRCARTVTPQQSSQLSSICSGQVYPVLFTSKVGGVDKTFVTCGSCADAGCQTCEIKDAFSKEGSLPKCLTCPPNQNLKLVGGQCLSGCDTNQFADPITLECFPCDLSCTTCSGDGPDKCDDCQTGYKKLIANSTFVCLLDDDSQKKNCSILNSYYDEDFNNCKCYNYASQQLFYYNEQCYTTGKWIKEVKTNSTVDIGVGEFVNSAQQSKKCDDKKCAVCVAPGTKTDCLMCRLGYFTEGRSCTACTANCDVCANDQDCVRCEKGTFQNQEDNLQCIKLIVGCPAGKYPSVYSAYQLNEEFYPVDEFKKNLDLSGTEPTLPTFDNTKAIIAINKWNQPILAEAVTANPKLLPWEVTGGKLVARGTKNQIVLQCVECIKNCQTCAQGWNFVVSTSECVFGGCPANSKFSTSASGQAQCVAIPAGAATSVIVTLKWYSKTVDNKQPFTQPLQIEGFSNFDSDAGAVVSWSWSVVDVVKLQKSKTKKLSTTDLNSQISSFLNGIETDNKYLQVKNKNLNKGYAYTITVTASVNGLTGKMTTVIQVPADFSSKLTLNSLYADSNDFYVTPTSGKGGDVQFKAGIQFTKNSQILKDISRYSFNIRVIQDGVEDLILDLPTTTSETTFSLAPLSTDVQVKVQFEVQYNGDIYTSQRFIKNLANPSFSVENSKLLNVDSSKPSQVAITASLVGGLANPTFETGGPGRILAAGGVCQKVAAATVKTTGVCTPQQSSPCCGQGTCTANPEQNAFPKYTCICQSGFFGDLCNLDTATSQKFVTINENIATKLNTGKAFPATSLSTSLNTLKQVTASSSLSNAATINTAMTILNFNKSPDNLVDAKNLLGVVNNIIGGINEQKVRRRRFLSASDVAALDQKKVDAHGIATSAISSLGNSMNKGDSAVIIETTGINTALNIVDLSTTKPIKVQTSGPSEGSKIVVAMEKTAFGTSNEAVIVTTASKATALGSVTGTMFSQDVVDITIQQAKTGTNIPVNYPQQLNLINFIQNVQAPNGTDIANTFIQCSYVDSTKTLVTTGCSTNSVKVLPNNVAQVNCSCSHLTSFAISLGCIQFEGGCVQTCPSTYTLNTVAATCVCKTPCTACSGSATTFACSACVGTANNNRVTSKQCKCKVGYFDDSAPDCKQCYAHCGTCTNPTNCQVCLGEQRVLAQNCKCGDGFYDVQGKDDCGSIYDALMSRLTGGIIAVIVIVPIVCIGLIAGGIWYYKKKKLEGEQNQPTSKVQNDVESEAKIQAKDNQQPQSGVFKDNLDQQKIQDPIQVIALPLQ